MSIGEKSIYQKKYNIYNKIMYNVFDLTNQNDTKNRNEYFEDNI